MMLFKNIVSREELARFRECSKTRLVFDLSLVWLQALIGALLIIFSNDAFLIIIGIFIIGSAQHGMGLISHEGAHTLLSNSRGLNDFISRWFFAAPVLLPFSLYRQRHFQHHRYSCTADDTKELYKRKITSYFFIFEILKSLFGLDFLLQVISVLNRIQADSGKRNLPNGMKTLYYDFFSIFFAQLIIFIVVTLLCGWHYYFLSWLIPLLTVNMLCGKLRSIVEHQPMIEDVTVEFGTKYYKGTNRAFTRSISPTLFEKFFLSNINFSFHAEHHLFPSVSYQYLPVIRDRIATIEKQLLLIDGYSHKKSYFNVLWSLIFDFS